jgi:hypothetical protein
MHSAEYCRIQSEECRCLVPLARSEAEATVLRSLSHSWVMIANQSDRYAEITKKAPPLRKSRGELAKNCSKSMTMRSNRAIMLSGTAAAQSYRRG